MSAEPKQRVFVVRLEAPDSEHFRETNIQAPDERTAKAWLALREARMVAYRLEDAELDKLEKREKADGFAALPADARAKLAVHRQETPYEIVSVREKK